MRLTGTRKDCSAYEQSAYFVWRLKGYKPIKAHKKSARSISVRGFLIACGRGLLKVSNTIPLLSAAGGGMVLLM
jgi:hypothetical protein